MQHQQQQNCNPGSHAHAHARTDGPASAASLAIAIAGHSTTDDRAKRPSYQTARSEPNNMPATGAVVTADPASAAPERLVRVDAPNAAAVGLRLVCISDTHDFQSAMPRPIPKGDILLHAGDFTCRGTREEVASFVAWMCELLESGIVRHVVCIAGNHELGLEPGRAKHPAVVLAQQAMRQSLHDVPNMHFLEVCVCVCACAWV